ncbi:MAG TPA: nuclear transport factor 2 family protein [Edaphobacter sp.]|nr:nuclear transport factor 2 family protein [Edaphobacter sp.]
MKASAVLFIVIPFTGGSLFCHQTNGAFVVHAQSSAASTNSKDRLQEKIVAKEREGLDALETGNLDVFGTLTAEEAVMVDAQGPATKVQVLKNVSEFRLIDYSMDDLKFVPVSATTGLISYKITEKGTSHGHEFMAKAYVSSLWTKRGSQWVCLFSQETGTK